MLQELKELKPKAADIKQTRQDFNVMQKKGIAANSPDGVDESEEDRQRHVEDAGELLDYAKDQALTRKTYELASRLVPAESHEWDQWTEISPSCPCSSGIKSELDESQRVALIYHTWMSEKNACISDVYDCFDNDDFAALVRAVVCSSPGQLDQVAARIRSKFSIAQNSALEAIIDNHIEDNF